MHDTEADLGERPGGPGAPLCLDQTEGRKNVFENGHPPPPYLRVWMTGSPLLWRSGSATMVNAILGGPGADSRVGRKGGASLFKHGSKSPWVPTLTELFPKIQADAGSWLGTKNALYYCAQSANSFSWVLFVSSYTTAIVSPHLPGSFTKLVRARETFIFYFPNQKGRKKTFGLLSAGGIEFASRILCFWRITVYCKFWRCSGDEKVK